MTLRSARTFSASRISFLLWRKTATTFRMIPVVHKVPYSSKLSCTLSYILTSEKRQSVTLKPDSIHSPSIRDVNSSCIFRLLRVLVACTEVWGHLRCFCPNFRRSGLDPPSSLRGLNVFLFFWLIQIFLLRHANQCGITSAAFAYIIYHLD